VRNIKHKVYRSLVLTVGVVSVVSGIDLSLLLDLLDLSPVSGFLDLLPVSGLLN